jgi:hypothetical protein
MLCGRVYGPVLAHVPVRVDVDVGVHVRERECSLVHV